MSLPPLTKSLSARLLVLTVGFVMIAEVLIYTPSIANFRLAWLQERLASGHLAALAVLAAPDNMVTKELEAELLGHAGAYMVDLHMPGQSTLMLGAGAIPATAVTVDLRQDDVATLIFGAFETLLRTDNRVLHVIGMSPRDPENALVETVIDEAPLRQAMFNYSWRILGLSIVISLITAGLVFLALRWLMVRPMSRFTEKLIAFRQDPDDAATIMVPSRRSDELGVAERELRDMQVTVRNALRQQARLAALGTAVAKINHDLRNILATASLLSERLGASADPEAKKIAPALMAAIDRAADLCTRTLTYTREGGPPLRRSTVNLRQLVDAAAEDLGLAPTRWVNRVPEPIAVLADAEQLRRVLVNLGRNAVEAGAEHVTIDAAKQDSAVEITLSDDGPGLPPRAREHLFQPFAGTARPGGTGLGLAIAREIVAAHRGVIKLVESGAKGTTFSLSLPV